MTKTFSLLHTFPLLWMERQSSTMTKGINSDPCPNVPHSHEIKKADMKAPKRSLGMRMSGNLSLTTKPQNDESITELEALEQNTKTFIRDILSCPLKPHETMIAYHQIYLASVCCSLACTTLSKKEWDSVQNPLLNKLLPKLGLPKTFPRELVLGTKHHGGLGLQCLHGEQGMNQCLTLTKHLRL